MPQNSKDLDEESEAKAGLGRRTRAAVGAASAVDSPLLRRSTRAKPSASQEMPVESSSDISGRITRSRMTSTEPSVLESGRSLRSRKNSTASDATDTTDSEFQDVKKRITRRSLAATVVESPQVRVRRSSRAGSESKTMSPAVRSTRKTRASSVDLDDNVEGKQNMLLSQPNTPMKRTRASALPSEPSVAEESEHLQTISEKLNQSLVDSAEPNGEVESATKNEKPSEDDDDIKTITISSNDSISSKRSNSPEYGTPSEISVDNISGATNELIQNITDDGQKSMMDMPKVVLYKTTPLAVNLGNKENEKSNVIPSDKKLKFSNTVPLRRRSTVAAPVEKLEPIRKRNRSINDQLLSTTDILPSLDKKSNSIKSGDDVSSDESIFALIDAREDLMDRLDDQAENVPEDTNNKAAAVDSQSEEKEQVVDSMKDEKNDADIPKNDTKILSDAIVKLVKMNTSQHENTANKELVPERTDVEAANNESVGSKEVENEVEKMEVDEEEDFDVPEVLEKIEDTSSERESLGKVSTSPIKTPVTAEKSDDKPITEEQSEKSASEIENSFHDIPIEDLELADEGDSTSDNKEPIEKEDEYDLILVDKETMPTEEKQAILSQDGSDYDSDDTIIVQRCNPTKSEALSDDEPMDTAEDETKPDENESHTMEETEQIDKNDGVDEKLEDKVLQSPQIDTSEAKNDSVESEKIINESFDTTNEKISAEETSDLNETPSSPQSTGKIDVSETGESDKSIDKSDKNPTPVKAADDVAVEQVTPQSPVTSTNNEDVAPETIASPKHASDDDCESEEKNMSLAKISREKSKSNNKKLKQKKIKITEITSEDDGQDESNDSSNSDEEDDDEEEGSDQESTFNIFPAFLCDDSDDSDDDCFSGESDIANDMNLDGFTIEYPDDNIAGDECRASEEEESDSDDDNGSLKDFINDEEIEEEESSDDDVFSEDLEEAEEKEDKIEKKQKLYKKLVGKIIDSSSEDETEPLLITEIEEPAEMDEKKSPIKSNTSMNESNNANESPENTSNNENSEVTDKSNVSPSPEKALTKTPTSLKKQTDNTRVSLSSTAKSKKKMSSVSNTPVKSPIKTPSSMKKQAENIEILMPTDSEGKIKKKNKTPAKLDARKNLESNLNSPQTPKDSGEQNKMNKSVELLKTPVVSSLNQTMLTPQISSPDTKSLMKEKLNESLPILKSHRKNSIKSSRSSILETVNESNVVETSPENITVEKTEVQSGKKKNKNKKHMQADSETASMVEISPVNTSVEKSEVVELTSEAKKKKNETKKHTQLEDDTVSAANTSGEKSAEIELQSEKKKKKNKMAQVENFADNVIENNKAEVLADETEIKLKSKKKKKRMALESEAISVQLEEETPKPKKKKKQKNIEINEETVSNPLLKSMELDEKIGISKKDAKKGRVKKTSESEHEAPSVTPIKKSLVEALKITTEDGINSAKKKKKTKASKSEKSEQNLTVPKTSNLKRLSTDFLDNLPEAHIRPQKRRKLNPKIVPSKKMFDSQHEKPDNLTIEDTDYIPLSSSGGTTQFKVVKLKKFAKKQSKTSSAAMTFRERILSRHPREPVSAYFMYQQKMKAANFNKY